MLSKEKKEFAGWWFFVFILILFVIGVFTILKPAGMWWERQVIVQSHQYQEARKSQMANFQAQLAQIESRLLSEKNPVVIDDLRSQQAMLNVQINTARNR